MSSREFDLVLLGPTGYTGKFVAEHIYQSFPTTLKWAVAGRSASKIEGVLHELKQLDVEREAPEVLIVQLTPGELDALAKRTRLILNCVGPYHLYSTPVVAACAENGTHHIDVTGETPWIRRVLQQYNETAQQSGALIVSSCGFESAPADIVTWLAVHYMRTKLAAEPTEAVCCLFDIKTAGMSGGTAHSILSTLEGAEISELRKAFDNYCLATTPIPPTRTTPRKSLIEAVSGVRTVPDLGTLTTSPSGMADEAIVYRSSTLMADLYGPTFSYRQYLRISNAFMGALFHYAFNFTIALLIFAPFRWAFRQVLPEPGAGPSREETRNDIAEYRVLVSSNQKDGNGKSKKVLASILYQGSQYEMTGLLAAAAAKVVLERESDIKKVSTGFVTTATMGQSYVDELEKRGVIFNVKALD